MIKLKDLITEGKPRAGDYVKTAYGIAQINKIRRTIAYMTLPDKGMWLNDIKHLKPTGKKEKGKTLWTEGLITEGGDGILEPIQKAKSQRDAINYVKKFLKDEKSYGGDFGNIKNIKFVGNVSSEDKLDKMGMRYQDRSAVVGVVDGEYWWSIWRRD